jgi:uncharacterized protein (DUF1697 family)
MPNIKGPNLSTYIALFRGINVGGKNILRKDDLVAFFDELGCRNVRTYIQSGNVVFEATGDQVGALPARLREAIQQQRGFEPQVLVLTLDEFEAAMSQNPFPEAESDPKFLHLGFLAAAPVNPNLAGLESLKANGESFELVGKIFYLHAPEGVGRSRLAAKSEQLLGVPLTDRNWRTVSKIWEMARKGD